jgi:hypothetical protein
MVAAANAAKPSARTRAPAFEGGSVTIRNLPNFYHVSAPPFTWII